MKCRLIQTQSIKDHTIPVPKSSHPQHNRGRNLNLLSALIHLLALLRNCNQARSGHRKSDKKEMEEKDNNDDDDSVKIIS